MWSKLPLMSSRHVPMDGQGILSILGSKSNLVTRPFQEPLLASVSEICTLTSSLHPCLDSRILLPCIEHLPLIPLDWVGMDLPVCLCCYVTKSTQTSQSLLGLVLLLARVA